MTIDPRKAMRRAKRAAQTLVSGEAILARLREDDARALLIEGAEEEVPSVSKISELLFDEFGPDVKQLPVRQFIGLVVRAIMAEEGFELVETGVRIHGDTVFTTGAVYARPADEDQNPQDDDILRTMIASLSQAQKNRIAEMLEE